MRLGINSIRDQQNSASPIFSNIANRINYLQQKNQSVNKKLFAYANCLERRLLSQRSHNSGSTDKDSSTLKIHPSANFRIQEDLGRLQSENTAVLKGSKMSEKNYKTELENKEDFTNNRKHLKVKRIMQFRFNKMSSSNKESRDGLIPLESLKKGKRFLQKLQTKRPFNHSLLADQQPRLVHKKDNFLNTQSNMYKNKSPYTQILKSLDNRKNAKKPDQEKFKLIQIKKKLLQQEEKSLMEYEKCILYKQKFAEKIKNQNLIQDTTGPQAKKHIEQSQVFIYAYEDDS